jgi:iron complex outermembrane recepter protein
MAIFIVLVANSLHAQSMVNGHVYIAETGSPCSDAIVQAWPCGTTFSTDSHGAFYAECVTELDSLTVISHGFTTMTIAVDGRSHIDIPLFSLSVDLDQITVTGKSDQTIVRLVPASDLMQTLDRSPGIRSLDLGAGLIQPVLRGLMGSRVSILDGGVPLVGGRWGQDHGVLVDPILYDGIEWVPGGGHVWLGPDAVGGGGKFSSINLLSNNGYRTQFGTSYRMGDNKAKLYALCRVRHKNLQWHLGFSTSLFGDRNVPQNTFEYLGRTYEIQEGRLPNTSGTAYHGVAGLIYTASDLGRISIDFRWSDIKQGLFPGIVGIPTQSELMGDGNIYSVDLPHQDASRWLVSSKWMKPGHLGRTIRLALSGNERIENAPPHAHGYGPEPETDLSLYLHETHLFAESRWEGYHGAFGVQAELLRGTTDGWEFLIPNHYRDRVSAIADFKFKSSTLGARVDIIRTGNEMYSEPLYSINNEVIGEDIRATKLKTVKPSWALSWCQLIEREKIDLSFTATAYTRVPSNYALAANGIHHGTFRFERGNPDLNPETAIEARASISSSSENFNIEIHSFASLHKGFIHITPTSSFAAIAHAGQIYSFQATDAFRTGMEMKMNLKLGRGKLTTTSSLLGQWALETGLGLPFTPPADIINSYELPIDDRLSITLSHRAIAPSYLLARNEDFTKGASLLGVELILKIKKSEFRLEADNLLNRNWLDHISAYKTLGLVAQGRWVLLSWSMDLQKI